ncbi:MAG: hypothetical protein R6W96_06905 [Clostridia bacterium]
MGNGEVKGMDTRRAVKIIIALLVIINVLMGFYLFNITRSPRSFDQENEKTLEIMGYREITLSTAIPDDAGQVKKIQYADALFNEDSIAFIQDILEADVFITQNHVLSISTQVDIPGGVLDRYEADTVSKRLMDSIGFDHRPYVLESVSMEASSVFFLQYVYESDGQYFYESYIRVRVNEGGQIQCEIRQINHTDGGAMRGYEVIPASNILMSGILRTDNRSMNIIGIDSGYILDNEGETLHCWRIQFNDGTTRHFDSRSGKEIIK